MHKILESRHNIEKTNPWSGPGSRQEDKIEPIVSRFDGLNGTKFILWRKNAGSLKFRVLTEFRFFFDKNFDS